MGLFSLFKKDAEATEVAEGTERKASPTATAPASDHPSFTPPEAWNTEALTAPRPEVTAEKPAIGPVDAAQTAALQGKVIEQIKTVFDPEIPVDIYELGLIYDILVDAEKRVLVKMTLTSPACPSAQQIPSEVRYKVKAIPEVKDAWVEIEWEPPWSKDRMSEEAKLTLGMF
jgi:FeS assembly SUF system protein